MKLFSLDEIPFEPISHDPQLKKKVLARDPVSNVNRISHVVLPLGSSVSEHSHAAIAEIFFCIRGKSTFSVEGKSFSVRKGHLIIIEPGELHSITGVMEETELLYFHAFANT